MRVRKLLGEDIFVAYAREDALLYTRALVLELMKRRFACRNDQFDTLPSAKPPEDLRAAIRACRMLVVVGSSAAQKSDWVCQEIQDFIASRKDPQVLVVEFQEPIQSAIWASLLPGLPPVKEVPGALADGQPTHKIVEHVATSFQVRRRNQRLRVTFLGLAAAIAIAVMILVVLVARIGVQAANLAQSQGLFDRTKQQLSTATTTLESTKHTLGATESELSSVNQVLTTTKQERSKAVEDRDKAVEDREKANASLAPLKKQLDRTSEELAGKKSQLLGAKENLKRARGDLDSAKADTVRMQSVSAALRDLAGIDAWRLAHGYTRPEDLLRLVETAPLLRGAGYETETQAALDQALSLQPRLTRVVPGNIVGTLSNGKRLLVSRHSEKGQFAVVNFSADPAPNFLAEGKWSAVAASGARFMTVSIAEDPTIWRLAVWDSASLAGVGNPFNCFAPTSEPRFALSADGQSVVATCQKDHTPGLMLFDVSTGGSRFIPASKITRFDQLDKLRIGVGRDALLLVTTIDSEAHAHLQSFDVNTLSNSRRPCEGGDKAYFIDDAARHVAAACDNTFTTTCDFHICDARVTSPIEGAAPNANAPRTLHLQGRPEVAFSNDGSWIVTSEGGFVRVWDTRTGKREASLASHWDTRDLMLSGDRSHLAGRAGNFVWVMDTRTEEVLMMIPLLSGETLLALSEDGATIATGDHEHANLWRMSASVVTTFAGAATEAWLSVDGRYLVARGRSYRKSEEVDTQVFAAGPAGAPWVELGHERARAYLQNWNGKAPTLPEKVPLPGRLLGVSDSGLAMTGDARELKIWRMQTSELLGRLHLSDEPKMATFARGSREIAVAAGAQVEVHRWSAEDELRDACALLAANSPAPSWSGAAHTASNSAACR